ncbi:hypothetical protein M758_9G069800 [Ceratodon purpureus]|nr:hypothetical protein M758_9G069800 [Ceratodon purpureus]
MLTRFRFWGSGTVITKFRHFSLLRFVPFSLNVGNVNKVCCVGFNFPE